MPQQQQPCDLIPTTVSGCGSELTPPQTPQQTQASIITAAAISASNCLNNNNNQLGLQQQQMVQQVMQHQVNASNNSSGVNSQPIVQPLTSPVAEQQSNTTPVNSLGRNATLHHHPHHQTLVGGVSSPIANNGGVVMSPINTICNPIVLPPPNGCPGNGFATGNTAGINNTSAVGLDSSRLVPDGREDTPLTGDSSSLLPLEQLSSLPPV